MPKQSGTKPFFPLDIFLPMRYNKTMSKKDKRKTEDWDDGRTIAPMNGDELPPYRRMMYSGRKNKAEHKKDPNRIELTKKERRAMTRAFFLEMLPRLLMVLAGFGVVVLLMYLWLG